MTVTILHPPVVDLSDHCLALRRLMNDLACRAPVYVKKDGEVFGWAQAADWLELAGSVTKVDVLTGQDDDGLAYCETAMDYENDRSALLSQFVTSLTMFSFVWGAFESTAKVVSPPSIPKEMRVYGNDSLTARSANYLRYVVPDGVYLCALSKLRNRLGAHTEFAPLLPDNLGLLASAEAGQGLELVRIIRNRFAHGATAIPQRDDWNGMDSADNQIVRVSTRLVLLTIQMMLRIFFGDRALELETWRGDNDDVVPVSTMLLTLHLKGRSISCSG